MKKIVLYCSIVLLFAACAKKEVVKEASNTTPVFNDPNWTQIRVPNAREIYAITGNIDDTLVISYLGKNKAFMFTTDKGATWHESSTKVNPIMPALLIEKDTVYAFSGSGINAKTNHRYATISSYYSLDRGNTWKLSTDPNTNKTTSIGTVTSKNGTIFNLDYRFGAGSKASYTTKTIITKTLFGSTTAFTPPIAEQPLNLYIDQNDRLYVTTSGGKFNADGFFVGTSADDPAYIYISKKAISN